MVKKKRFKKVIKYSEFNMKHFKYALFTTFGIEILLTIVSLFERDVPVMLITNAITIPLVSIILILLYLSNKEVEYEEI